MWVKMWSTLAYFNQDVIWQKLAHLLSWYRLPTMIFFFHFQYVLSVLGVYSTVFVLLHSIAKSIFSHSKHIVPLFWMVNWAIIIIKTASTQKDSQLSKIKVKLNFRTQLNNDCVKIQMSLDHFTHIYIWLNYTKQQYKLGNSTIPQQFDTVRWENQNVLKNLEKWRNSLSRCGRDV